MKRFVLLLLLCSLLLCATGCKSWVADSYLSVADHVEQPLPTQESPDSEEPSVVTNRSELRGAVLSLVRNWTESAELPVRDYDGSISDDLAETVDYVMHADPVGAYAVDYIDSELIGDGASGTVTLSIVFRRSAAEIDSIVTVSDNDAAYLKIQQALSDFETALTLRIRSYSETDFAAYIRDYCLENPSTVLCLPETSADLYPNEGETRILELHFSYPAARDEMRLMLSSTQSIFNSAASYIRSGETDADRAALLFRFLTTRFDYVLGEEASTTPAYDLLCRHIAHSLSFACVFGAECRAAGIDCITVEGTRNGAAHYWNLLCLDGAYYHVDLMRSMERGETELKLLLSQELRAEGYVWDETFHPATPEPTPEPTPSPSTPTNSTEASETQQPTQSPTHAPTDEPTESPTKPTDSPAEPPIGTQPAASNIARRTVFPPPQS